MFISNPRMTLAVLATSTFFGAQADLNTRIANYLPITDVTEIVKQDLIQKEFGTIIGDETCVSLQVGKAYYESGDGTFLKNIPTYKGSTSPEVEIYQDYYGDEKYYDTWVQSALDGVATDFKDGNADFGAFAGVLERPGKDPSGDCVGREEAAKKGSAYLSGFVEVMQYLQQASDLVKDGCVAQKGDCTDALKAWDSAVAYFAGSLEGVDGNNDPDGTYGVGLYALADKRCDDYATCGPNGGTNRIEVAASNLRIMQLFAQGSQAIFSGDLKATKAIITEISQKLNVPFIQGTFRYAFRLSVPGAIFQDKEIAEGAAFAAASIPKLAQCSANAAKAVAAEVGIGQGVVGVDNVNFDTVKKAFECNYQCLNVRCDEVGSLFDGDEEARSKTCKDPKVCKKLPKKIRKKCKKYNK